MSVLAATKEMFLVKVNCYYIKEKVNLTVPEKIKKENHENFYFQQRFVIEIAGLFQWKKVYVYTNSKSEVVLKLKSKHVGGAFSKNSKCNLSLLLIT